MEVNDLERAAALAGVATVDLGGAGAGHRLEADMNGSALAHPAETDDASPRRDVWRELLFREINIDA